jgi:putative phage-type endonuclease
MLTEEQHIVRKSGVGGSDIAAIMGISRYKTARDIYEQKVSEEVPKEEVGSVMDRADVLHFGNELEDLVATEFSRRNDLKVQRKNDVIRHPQYDFMLANIDRRVLTVKAGLECKTSNQFMVSDWGPSGTDEVPHEYRLQCEHYMNCTTWPEWYLAVLIGGNQYRQYYIQQDDELSELVLQGVKNFWAHVEAKEPPELDWNHRSTKPLLEKLYPGTNGQTIFLPDNLVHWQRVKDEAEARIKEDEAVVTAAKNRILAAMGENSIGVILGCGVKYTRKKIEKKEYVSPASSYMDFRKSKYTPSKEA